MKYVAISRLKTLEGLAIKTLDLLRVLRCKYTSLESLLILIKVLNNLFLEKKEEFNTKGAKFVRD